MAETVIFAYEIIKLCGEVAHSFTEYLQNVKDAPRIVRSINQEVHTLTGVLENLRASLEYEELSASKESIFDALNNCADILCELNKLVAPEGVDDLESLSPSPRRARNTYFPFGPSNENRPISPYQRSHHDVNANMASLMQAQISREYPGIHHEQHALNMNQQLIPLRTATPSPAPTRKRSAMSLAARFKWPLFQQPKAQQLLNQLERQRSMLSLAIEADNSMNLSSINHSVKEIEATLDDGEKRRILGWLKPNFDMYEFHSEQHDKQEDETCEWITNSRGWKQWLDGGSSGPGGYKRFIWIYGIPGAGKTVLASFLIDNIAKHCRATGFSYYYCHNERNHDETISFLRWVVADLSRQIGRFIPKELEQMNDSGNFDFPGLLNCFLIITSQFKRAGQRVYLVVDAVDESKPRKRFLDVLVEIGTEPSFEHVSLLMTSRDEQDIRDKMNNIGNDEGLLPTIEDRNLGYEIDSPVPHTAITMSNGDVMRAIEKYVKKQVARNDRFKLWPADFRALVESELARNARGMFRWVAGQIDILERIYQDRDRVLKALRNLPETLFDTYARILESIAPEERAFARTALALICSNTSNIKSADVLVQASLHNVLHGAMHLYDIRMLKAILGCLVKITDLKKKPVTIFRRDEEGFLFQKASLAHYTVREFLFAKAKNNGEPRPAGEFALSDTDIRKLEMQVVFNGLQQWQSKSKALPKPQPPKCPTRYEEHCLDMSDSALRGDRRNLIVRNQSVWDSVVPCLIPDKVHLKSLRNERLRRRFAKWRKLCAFEYLPAETQSGSVSSPNNRRRTRDETGILASLILLRWPEFAQKYLQHSKFENLGPGVKQAIWRDEFSIDPLIDESFPRTFDKKEPMTLLRLCVLWKRLDFLELFINAGANFAHEPNIVFLALSNPYSEDDNDGSITGQLLKMLLERGADPNPAGYIYTPLQDAVHHLEEGWVQSLLIECRDANLMGDPNGEHPYGSSTDRQWHRQHPLQICRTTKPKWQESDAMEEQINKSRRQVELLLTQYGAHLPTTPPPPQSAVINLCD
ncbi:hypothetical protein K449DRAFT_435470 [Hypoxylon sp. EC38]|nr:hypothetical protein K449DRAFT_435470 [Hypoxylon sp. EC38]